MKKIKLLSYSAGIIVIVATLIGNFGLKVTDALGERGTPKRPVLTLHYVANEGVMLSIGKAKILIDAIFDDPNPNYRAPSADTLKKIIEGEAPFDNINLILFTHKHGDHFSARIVAKVMENNPKPLLMIPADAIPDLQGAAKNWSAIKSRIFAPDLKIGESTEKAFGTIQVKSFRTRHSGDRETPHNLVYLIRTNRWKILHEGDSDGHPDTFEKFGLNKESIDLALVHFWFPLDSGGAKILQEILVPDHIALIHLPKRLEGDAPTKIDQVKKYYKDIVLLLPDSSPRTYK